MIVLIVGLVVVALCSWAGAAALGSLMSDRYYEWDSKGMLIGGLIGAVVGFVLALGVIPLVSNLHI